ncbi:MAG: hypothetical protein RIR72_865, partial [Actinomycetota bacterium]
MALSCIATDDETDEVYAVYPHPAPSRFALFCFGRLVLVC